MAIALPATRHSPPATPTAPMIVAQITQTIPPEWAATPAVAVGGPPDGHPPARHVLVARGAEHLLRVDVRDYGPDCFTFEAAVLWRGLVVVGFGSHLHLVSLADHSATTLPLGAYFGHLYPTDDYLLVASAERVFRIEPDRRVFWTSEELGIDGIVVGDPGPPIIRGEGEWDPPGGWVPFELLADTGRRREREPRPR